MHNPKLCHALLVLMVAGLALSACCPLISSRMAPTATPLPVPTLDETAVKEAAVATLVARLAGTLTVTPKPQPTATHVPTAVDTATPTLVPSATPEPTLPPESVISLELTGMHYEAWGRPAGDCQHFDDSHPMRKFQLEITIVNHGGKTLGEEWYPQFYASNGRLLVTCFYGYSAGSGFPSVPPGERRPVTFSVFAENNESVKTMKINVFGAEYRRCFASSGASVACP